MTITNDWGLSSGLCVTRSNLMPLCTALFGTSLFRIDVAALVAGRIADLRAAGDSLGVERWVAIGAALNVRSGGSGEHVRT